MLYFTELWSYQNSAQYIFIHSILFFALPSDCWYNQNKKIRKKIIVYCVLNRLALAIIVFDHSEKYRV